MPTTAPAAPPVRGLHHFAWRCRDSEETRRFYEDLLGLPLAHVIKSDHVPSTGEYAPTCTSSSHARWFVHRLLRPGR